MVGGKLYFYVQDYFFLVYLRGGQLDELREEQFRS
jgi:predicted Ser/Thr protein kinase